MLRVNQGLDIVEEIGQAATADAALSVMVKGMDSAQFRRLPHFKNPSVLKKIANAMLMCEPDRVFVNTGSAEDLKFIRWLALAKDEEAPLPMDDHTIHYDLKEEQDRIIDRTYYVANEDEPASTHGLRKSRDETLETVREGMGGIMNGRTMIVGLYARGPVGAQVSNPAIEISSSADVCHSTELRYLNIYADFEREVDCAGHLYTNIHSKGLNRAVDQPDARVVMDRSHRTTYSFNSTYAGNTQPLKKGNHRISVDCSAYEKRAPELSEHMFITDIDGSGGRVTRITGNATSGCGKTTTAMAGNHFAGDDLARMWITDDGTVRSINPEAGIFGNVEDVNKKGDPIQPLLVAKNTDQGEVIDASIVSAATTMEVGATGVKRTPWVNAPFTPGIRQVHSEGAVHGEGKISKLRPGLAIWWPTPANNQAGKITIDLFFMLFITGVLGAVVMCYIYLVTTRAEVPADLRELTKQIVAYCIGVGSGLGLISRKPRN